jgi:peptidyl-dipeptidase A
MTTKFSQKKMKELSQFNWRNFTDKSLRRSFFRAICLMGDSGIQDTSKIYKLKTIKSDMVKKYSTAKIKINNTMISLDPEVNMIFEKSRSYDQLAEVWGKWRDASGKTFASNYPQYVELSNQATTDYGFENYGQYSRASFESPDLGKDFDSVYGELEELYRLLHAYTKRKLAKMYPGRVREATGVLPGHVLGDVWAQQWHNIYEDIKPYKDKPLLDITDNMKAKVSKEVVFCLHGG